MLSSSRICECNSGLCVKNSLCNYDPKTDPYQSSSGIDMNEYERSEHFENVKNSRKCGYRNREQYKKDNMVSLIIILIIISIIIFVFLKKNRK
jgi:hypothetical protein